MATSEFGKHESGDEMMVLPATGSSHAAALAPDSPVAQRLMPWILSVLLHLGMGVIMAFIGMLIINPKAIVNPDDKYPVPSGIPDEATAPLNLTSLDSGSAGPSLQSCAGIAGKPSGLFEHHNELIRERQGMSSPLDSVIVAPDGGELKVGKYTGGLFGNVATGLLGEDGDDGTSWQAACSAGSNAGVCVLVQLALQAA